MPRFFFDTRAGFLHRDEDGQEFENVEVAGAEALRALREMAQHEHLCAGMMKLTCDVRDDVGSVVYRATLVLVGNQVR